MLFSYRLPLNTNLTFTPRPASAAGGSAGSRAVDGGFGGRTWLQELLILPGDDRVVPLMRTRTTCRNPSGPRWRVGSNAVQAGRATDGNASPDQVRKPHVAYADRLRLSWSRGRRLKHQRPAHGADRLAVPGSTRMVGRRGAVPGILLAGRAVRSGRTPDVHFATCLHSNF